MIYVGTLRKLILDFSRLGCYDLILITPLFSMKNQLLLVQKKDSTKQTNHLF